MADQSVSQNAGAGGLPDYRRARTTADRRLEAFAALGPRYATELYTPDDVNLIRAFAHLHDEYDSLVRLKNVVKEMIDANNGLKLFTDTPYDLINAVAAYEVVLIKRAKEGNIEKV